jgi:hypothetical protein
MDTPYIIQINEKQTNGYMCDEFKLTFHPLNSEHLTDLDDASKGLPHLHETNTP